jgi:hypothetical protein
MLAEGVPAEFGEFLDYARGLDFLRQPDYSRFRRLFRTIFESRGFQSNAALDWTVVQVPPLPRETPFFCSPRSMIPISDSLSANCESTISTAWDPDRRS